MNETDSTSIHDSTSTPTPGGSSSGTSPGSGTSPSGQGAEVPSWARSAQSIAKPNIDKWWEPGKDVPIDGVMAFHDAIRDSRSGRPRRVFIVRDSSRRGFHWGVGERSGLVKLRNVPVGSRVFLRFVGRRETGNIIDGQKQTIIDFDVRAETVLPEEIAVSTPPARGGAAPSLPAADDEIPF